jgi:UTP--glucose-1-phosphate uridylyltransferase
MMIKKAVIAAAGLGTRMLSVTKETPKEMLPLYTVNRDGLLGLKPVLQLIFEQVYDFGIRDFCFIVGRGKRAIEDHFTPDYSYNEILRRKSNIAYEKYALALEDFYEKLKNCAIFWVNQSPPLGFGHAVLQASPYIADDEDFLLFAGDTLILSERSQHIERLVSCYMKEKADVAFLMQNVEDPQNYGVVSGVESFQSVYCVKRVVEKPAVPESNLAIVPIYIFRHEIFNHLKHLRPDPKNEIQLTDAIQSGISMGNKVVATKVGHDELRLDVGTPETYFKAQLDSFKYHSQSPAKRLERV